MVLSMYRLSYMYYLLSMYKSVQRWDIVHTWDHPSDIKNGTKILSYRVQDLCIFDADMVVLDRLWLVLPLVVQELMALKYFDRKRFKKMKNLPSQLAVVWAGWSFVSLTVHSTFWFSVKLSKAAVDHLNAVQEKSSVCMFELFGISVPKTQTGSRL